MTLETLSRPLPRPTSPGKEIVQLLSLGFGRVFEHKHSPFGGSSGESDAVAAGLDAEQTRSTLKALHDTPTDVVKKALIFHIVVPRDVLRVRGR